MSPTVGWTELDYFRARDSARAAWQATNLQLELGLDEPQVSRAAGNSAAACGSSSPTDSGLAAGDKSGLGIAPLATTEGGMSGVRVPISESSPPAASPPSPSYFPEGGLDLSAEGTSDHPPLPATLATPSATHASPASAGSRSAA